MIRSNLIADKTGSSERIRITVAIQSLLEEWIATDKVENAKDVGSGLCYEFCDEIERRLTDVANLSRCETEIWWKDAFVADIDKLEKAKQLPGQWTTIPKIEMVIGSATHAWISWNGFNFDATAPEGCELFLKMPFFLEQITAYCESQSISNGS